MGMTYWVQILNGKKLESHESDLSALYKASETLDALCAELGVEKVSAFADYTDAEYAMSEELDGDEDEEAPTDPETGAPYSVKDMAWFDIAAGVKTLTAIQKRLQKEAGLPAPLAKARKQILEDLADCMTPLQKAAKGCKFHLAAIM